MSKRVLLVILFLIYIVVMVGIMYHSESDSPAVYAFIGALIGYKANSFIREYKEAKGL